MLIIWTQKELDHRTLYTVPPLGRHHDRVVFFHCVIPYPEVCWDLWFTQRWEGQLCYLFSQRILWWLKKYVRKSIRGWAYTVLLLQVAKNNSQLKRYVGCSCWRDHKLANGQTQPKPWHFWGYNYEHKRQCKKLWSWGGKESCTSSW